jgi:hypothetical protein
MSWYRDNFDNSVAHDSEVLAVSRTADVDVSDISASLTISPYNVQGQEVVICPSDSCPAWIQVAVVDRSTAITVVRFEYRKLNETFPGYTNKGFLVNARIGHLNEEPFTVHFNGKLLLPLLLYK